MAGVRAAVSAEPRQAQSVAGESLLAAIAEQVGALHLEKYGFAPAQVTTYARDDLVVVVTRDVGLTAAERTLLEAGAQPRC